MIWLIAKRELYSNIITFRFLVGLVLCLALITASTFVLTKDYKVRLESYGKSAKLHTDALKAARTHSDISPTVDRPPSPLGFLCIGSDKELGNTVENVSYREIPREATGQGSGNPLMSVFPSLDMALIIQVILSLLALLLAYDAFSGEREQGTLAITLSNPVPRHSILLGKLLGGMISVALPLAAGTLVGLIVVLTSGSVALDGSAWARIGLVFLCSLLYISAIFMLGMLVSARTSRSATSLVILLFIWVASVMLMPNMGPYVARHISKVEDKAVVDAKREVLDGEFWNATYQFGREQARAGKFPPDLWRFMDGSIMSYMNPYPIVVQYAPRENMNWFLEGLKRLVPLHMEYADRIWGLYRNYEAELNSQVSLSNNLSRISPAWTYYNAASALAGTDSAAYTRFMEQARRYRQQLINYSSDRRAFSSLSFFTPMKMEDTLTFDQLVEIESKEGTDAINRIKSSYCANAPLLKDIPVFSYQPESLADGIGRALPDLVIIVLLNLVFFLAAYASFMRREVK